MPKSIQVAKDVPAGSFSQNQSWLSPDYYINDLGKLRVNVALSTASVVEYTVNGGVNWIKINAGDALIVNCSYGFDVYVRAGDQFNLRSPTSGTTTVVLCRTDSIKDEG